MRLWLFALLGWQPNARTARFIQESTGRGCRGMLRKIFGFQGSYYGVYKNQDVSTSWKNVLTPEQQQAIMSIVSASPLISRFVEAPPADVRREVRRCSALALNTAHATATPS